MDWKPDPRKPGCLYPEPREHLFANAHICLHHKSMSLQISFSRVQCIRVESSFSVICIWVTEWKQSIFILIYPDQISILVFSGSQEKPCWEYIYSKLILETVWSIFKMYISPKKRFQHVLTTSTGNVSNRNSISVADFGSIVSTCWKLKS